MQHDGIKKLYYAIGEVAELTGLEAHVLRYWETEFEELAPRKNRAGRRIYTDEDIAMVRRIQRLLRDDKYTLEGARQVLARREGDLEEQSVDETLRELRAFLEHLVQQL